MLSVPNVEMLFQTAYNVNLKMERLTAKHVQKVIKQQHLSVKHVTATVRHTYLLDHATVIAVEKDIT